MKLPEIRPVEITKYDKGKINITKGFTTLGKDFETREGAFNFAKKYAK